MMRRLLVKIVILSNINYRGLSREQLALTDVV